MNRKWVLLIPVLFVALVVYFGFDDIEHAEAAGNPNKVTYTGLTNLYVSNNLVVDGTTSASGAVNTAGVVTLGAGTTLIQTAESVSLTSPTVQFSATGKHYIVLTSDANQTGVRPIDGTTGQLLVIRSGAGSNTMRFDDTGSTIALGANITLTEAQDDYLTLQCTLGGSGDDSTWAAVNEHQN